MKKTLQSLIALFLALAVLAPLPAHAATAGSINLQLKVNETATTDLAIARWDFASNVSRMFANGSSTNQANKVFHDTATLAGSGATSYDLDGTLTGALGTVTFSRIYAIVVWRETAYAASTQDENLTIGGDFYLSKILTGWVDDAVVDKVTPNGMWMRIAPDATGIAVTATTGDVLTITNASSADSVTYNVLVVGS